MEEKDSDSEEEKNNINTYINNKIKKLEDNNSLSLKSIYDEEKKKSIDISSFKEDEAKLGKKILCPKAGCFENCIIIVEPHSLEVNYECRYHNNKSKMDIIDFVKKSGISKEGKEKCSKCHKFYEDLVKNKKKLYKCSCRKNYCEDCKNEHKTKENDKTEHNMVDFETKDYICNCNENGKTKFNSFCIECKQNLCVLCGEKHKEHKKINFGELKQLTKGKKAKLKNKIKMQEKLIDKFNEIIDDWLLRIKKIIDNYKKKLELYNQINYVILNQYNVKKNFYESIKNIEYIRTDFDNNFYDLINAEDDYLLQNSIICKIINENITEYKAMPKLYNEYQIKTLQLKDTINLNEEVKNICELKKRDLLIVNIYNKNINKDEILIYKKIKENTENKENKEKKYNYFIINEDKNILSLKELKDGYLLIVQNNQFKIIDITISNSVSKNEIQKMELEENEHFIDIIELINGYLISISFSNSDIKKENNKIIFWNKNFMSGNYERDKTINIKEKPRAILEINKNHFVVLSEGNNLYIYDSKIIVENKKINIINDKPGINSFRKMIKVIEDGIFFIYEKNLILFSITSLQMKVFGIEYYHYIDHICNISNINNYFLATSSEENNNGIFLITIELSKYRVFTEKKALINNTHSLTINYINQLKDGIIITGVNEQKANGKIKHYINLYKIN